MEPLLKYPDAAKVLHCSKSKLEKMVMAREIPYVKIGKLVRFRPSELEQWLDRRGEKHEPAIR